MYGRRVLLLAFGALSILTQGVPTDEQALKIRQDPGAAPPSSSQAPSQPPSSTPPPTSASADPTSPSASAPESARPTPVSSDVPSTLTSKPAPISDALSTTFPPPTSTLADNARPTATNGTSSQNDPQLPVQPTITPALGIAGALMILSGAVYTVIGVKNKWLHISFSVCYLVALSIVVLLDYIAHPPISNGIQGAYFVAALIPGCILGGASLVFKDIVEGMGCLLGGFCFGMWIMVLKSGGITDSMGARIGVICGLAGAAFSLSFSHHTREPGLIACLSFAGATVIILGVDMFSRAGLGYFWLYIWNLNDQLFPLGTETYPMTRGIKVEIAAIIIIAVAGSMSQMRLWKLIKEKRAKRAEQRQRDEEERAVLEEENARDFKKQQNKDLKQWNHDYDGRSIDESASTFSTSQVDSGVHSNPASIKKASFNVRNIDQDGVELGDMSAGSRRSSGATNSSHRLSKDRYYTSVEPLPTEGHRPKQSNPETLKALEKISERPKHNPSIDRHSDVASVMSGPSGPEVTPLPFQVPEEGKGEGKDNDDDVKSIATAGESVAVDEILHQGGREREPLVGRKLKRTSGPSMGYDIPHVDDARSSLAATLDGISSHGGSLPALSRSGTPLPDLDNDKTNGGMYYTLHQRNQSAGDLVGQQTKLIDDSTTKETGSDRRHSMHLPGDKPDSNLGSLANLPKPGQPESENNLPAIVATRARSNTGGSGTKGENKPATLTKDLLPEGQSQTVGLYRTNEWAKHQALAETPEYEELAPPSEPGVAVEYGRELAAPVNVASLQETAFGSPTNMSSKQKSSKNPYRNKPDTKRTSSGQTYQTPARTSAGAATPVYSSFNNYSTRKNSSSSLTSNTANPNGRTASGNQASQPLLESPSEEDVVPPLTMPKNSRSSAQLLKSSNPQSKDNLMRLRDDKLKARMSTTSFAVPEASTSTVNTAGLNPGQGSREALKTTKEEDDVPLSQRRNTLKEKRASSQQPSQHYQLNRASTNPYNNRSSSYNTVSAANAGQGGLPYNAHQPQRGSTVDPATRESRLASWRASMTQQSNPTQPTFAPPNMKIEANRQQMLELQRRQGEESARQDAEKRMRDSAMDQSMRSGPIADKHREMMRAMQRQASTKTGEASK